MIDASEKADVVICGAGIVGIATAYFLTKVHGIKDVVLVDNRSPLTLTSDKSSEGYRNWWPGPGDDMVRFMNRSIDLLEELAAESGNRFHMNRRGYVYLTADPQRAHSMREEAEVISNLGAGALRVDHAYEYDAAAAFGSGLSGADLITDQDIIQGYFPFLAEDTAAMLHARRCGWLSAQQLGVYLLEQARERGARLIKGKVSGASVINNQVEAVQIRTADGLQRLATKNFVIAAGPLLAEAASLLGISLPIYNEPHNKIAFEDTEGIISRDAPLMIWNDPLLLPWEEDEKADLAAYEETSWLLNEFPPGLHFRPEGGPGSQTILVLWPYHVEAVKKPTWPLNFDPEFIEVVMRGLTRMIPGLSIYLKRMIRPTIDGGYYSKTRENRPLICPLAIGGAYVIGALSGFGIMAAPGAAELLTAHIAKTDLPGYGAAFDLARYQDPGYKKRLENWSSTAGQL